MRRGAVGALLLAAVSLAGARMAEMKVRAARPALVAGGEQRDAALPPSVQLASALLGSFRGILVDVLWIRVESLGREGRHFAAGEIARWITALQSRIEASWSFQAWNLGVNVPAMLPAGERWPYVRSALELLWRDGLRANPSSLDLRYEIAWFWLHKIGGDLDAAAPLYRREVRRRVAEILGPKPWAPGELARAEEALPLLAEEPAVMERVRGDPIFEAYERALRAAAWREAFGVPMSAVAETVRRYGEVDIGSPESFAVFWAADGLRAARGRSVRLDALSLWRIRIRALVRLFRRGEMHLAAAVDRDYRELIDLAGRDPVHRDQQDLLRGDERDFLRGAVPLLFLNGWRASAGGLFARLRELDGGTARFASAEDFAFAALASGLTPETATRAEIITLLKALLMQGVRAWSRGEEEGARAYLEFARDMHGAARRAFGEGAVPPLSSLLKEVRAGGARPRGRGARGEEG